MKMSKYFSLACLVLLVCSGTAIAQPKLPVQINVDSNNRFKDVEGTIWEFKVIDRAEKNASKKTKMTGKIRIKQASVFAVGKVKLAEKEEKKEEKAADEAEGVGGRPFAFPDRLKRPLKGPGAKSGSDKLDGEIKGLLSQKIGKEMEEDTGGERVGDLTKSLKSQKMFRFDEDDKFELSGVVVVKPDTKKRNGVWLGRYDEFVDGKKKKRWNFELRQIQE